MRTQSEIDLILKNVQAKLDARSNRSKVPLKVQPDYLVDDDWLNIVVIPDGPGMRAYEYVETLGEVQKELRADGVDHVLLVPSAAD